MSNMKITRILVLCAMALAAAVQAFGQDTPAIPAPELAPFSLHEEMSASGKGIFMGGVPISYAQAKSLLRPYPEAFRHLRAGRGWSIASWTAGFAGGWMVGWGIGSTINPTYGQDRGAIVALTAGGAALIVGGIGLAHIGIRSYRKAARDYNAATAYDMSLSLTGTPGGFGLQFSF
jgi:hypothetical protein